MDTRPMDTAELSVPDISCAHCKVTIEKSLGGTPGVVWVEVDVDTKAVRVTYDRAVTDQDVLRAMLADLGYPTT
ncbi:MAG: heavy-metal-associated domain-containing protein [Actinomycetota bacterium]|jgi:copper chaperone CopZ|nr:heavy-metal-associated domain-containing protein [Actinomycetota bacterium]MDA8360118.1 heavy-metal-associated domain-containing protein [Actinomycetota bacterium]